MLRTEPQPEPHGHLPVDAGHGSSVPVAADALTSGVRTSTPWRRASCTSVCGE